jgi:hypothetical protein
MTSAITKHLTVTEAVRAYEQAVAQIRHGFAEVAAAEALLRNTFLSNVSVRDRYSRSTLDFTSPDDALFSVHKGVWRAIVERLELRRMLSIQRAKELDQMLDKGELPEITEENVAAFVRHFDSNLDDMLGEAIEEVFDWLRPRHNRYKTNSELEIGRRVILSYVVEAGYGSTPFRVNYNYDRELTALENVFTALDGQGQITKTHYSALSNAIKESPDGTGQTPYFRFRACKNRNLHLEFLRLDLLERFNQIAGGRRLRPQKESAA